MHPVEHPCREILREQEALIHRIVAITSRRRRLTDQQEIALSRFVLSELDGPDVHGLGRFRGLSSVSSYLTVVVQRLCQALARTVAPSDNEATPLQDAIRQSSTKLSSRETLVLKMWFETGMTTQKIAHVLRMDPRDVHAVIAERTGGVQRRMAESHPPPTMSGD